MNVIINKLFDLAAEYFDKIPGLNKIKGARTIVGFVGMAVVAGLQANHVGNSDVLLGLQIGFSSFTGLALNAKGRPE